MRALTLLILVAAAAAAQDDIPPAYLQNPVIRQGQYVLWHDPGAVGTLDFRYGIGGKELAPTPPFTFVAEDMTGTEPKVSVKDANGRHWSVKFGREAASDTFCTRLAYALGYYVEPTYLVPEGAISGVHGLRRASGFIHSHGRFENGRFQLRSSQPHFLRTADWSWTENPFLRTPEFGGLKILMMLVSNWDNKDARDEGRGSNTAIYEANNLLYYFIDDWGGAMGAWGKFFSRSKWNASSFLQQSHDFVKAKDGKLHWGYVGQHSADVTRDVTPGDARWLLQFLGRITDDQIRTGLAASGASGGETEKYVRGLRMRIQALQNAVDESTGEATRTGAVQPLP